MRMVIAAALIAASAASATPASAYVRHPYAAAHYAYHGGVAHPYAAARVVRGAAVGAAVVGAAAAGDYYNGYSQPYYDSGHTFSYGTAYNTGYGGHVLGCGIGNWRCNAAASGYAQPYYNGGDTYGYGSYGTSYTPRGYYAASPSYDSSNSGDTYSYATNYGTGYSNAGYYAVAPGYGGHVLGCGIGNWRCNAAASGYTQPYDNSGDTYETVDSNAGAGSYVQPNYGTGYINAGYYAAAPGYRYGGHVLGCGIGNQRCW